MSAPVPHALGRTRLLEHDTGLPVDCKELRKREASATSITIFAPNVLPDLLLTADYARVLLERDPTVPADEVDERVMALLHRQNALWRKDGPVVRAFIGLHGLNSEVPDAATTAKQRDRLLDLVRDPRRKLRVQVVPTGFCPTEHFTLLESPRQDPVVYVRSAVTELLLSRPEHVQVYRNVIDSLCSDAWKVYESHTFVAELTYHDPDDASLDEATAHALACGINPEDYEAGER